MKSFIAKHATHLKATLFVPGDKSIAHRSVFLSAISSGKTSIYNFPPSDDCLATLNVFRSLGLKITFNKQRKSLIVYGNGLYGLRPPAQRLFINESGTTMRLLIGLLAGFDFRVTLAGGKGLSKRPMERVTGPLRMMGARIKARVKRLKPQGKSLTTDEFLPITIEGSTLHGISYRMKVASAQVKSAILLAGLYAKGKTTVIEPFQSRDHTERMLKLFKADAKVLRNKVVITGGHNLVSPGKIYIPGDISSASFFIVLATIVTGSKFLIKNVNVNPTRAGIIRVLKRMGSDIRFAGKGSKRDFAEPTSDLLVESSQLKATRVTREEIPSLIDELPILMVASAVASGVTVFEGVEELRVKETDRIRSMTENLRKMGVRIGIQRGSTGEKLIIHGQKELIGASVRSFGDHRTAMSMIVAGLKATGNTRIDDIECINKSFPQFVDLIKRIAS